MSRTVKLSIIVPVFNAELYLEQCIRSVLDQSWRDLELILVNDGSTDASLQICLQWECDPRVRILSTENRGVSHARNMGLNVAAGEWIMFLDSDDYLLEGCLEKLMALCAPDAQQILADYTSGRSKARAPRHAAVDAEAVYKMSLDPVNNRLLPDFFEIKPVSLAACWARLYRGSVIREKGIRFHEGMRVSEDMLFNLDYLSGIEQVMITDLPVLYYRCNTASVTRVFRAGHLADRFCFFDILKERQEADAAVHVVSLLFYEICKIERYTSGHERRQLERQISGYLSQNRDILRRTRGRALSAGRWQRCFYKAAAVCFGSGLDAAGFVCLRFYAGITKGEVKNVTRDS